MIIHNSTQHETLMVEHAQRADDTKTIETSVCSVQSEPLHTAQQPSVENRRPAPGEVILSRLVHNVDDDKFQAELSFCDVNGQTKTCLVPRSYLDSASTLARFLADKGAELPSDRSKLSDLINEIPKAHSRVTRRSGWHGPLFVLPMATFGTDDAGPLGMECKEGTGSQRGARKGCLEAWKRDLKVPLECSSYLTFGVSLSFAAPLAALIGVEETAAFHLYGESNAGKTLVSKAAESTIGRAQESDLHTLHATKAGLSDVMARHNGTLLNINELKTGDAAGGVRTFLALLAHVMTSGSGRNRSDFAKRDSDLAQRNWCVFGLTNMERSLETICDGRREMGERARHIDIPVPTVHRGGIFDGKPVFERSAPPAELAKQIAATIDANYGVAFAAFMRRLVHDREGASERFQADVDRFVKKAAGPDPWEQRFARKFGYVYAGGLAAIRYRVLPITRVVLRRACRKLHSRARSSIMTEPEQEAQVFSKLKRSLDDRVRFPRIEHNQAAPADFRSHGEGFRREFPRIGKCLGIRNSVLKRWARTNSVHRRVIDKLRKGGALLPSPNGDLTQIRALKGGGRQRYVMLRIGVLKKMVTEQSGRTRPA